MILAENPEFKQYLKHTNKNGTVDHGIVQINSCNLQGYYKLGFTDIFDIEQNIEYGTLKLKWAYEKYPDWNMTYRVTKISFQSNYI